MATLSSHEGGTTLAAQETGERLFEHDEDLPRMRGFNLWHRRVVRHHQSVIEIGWAKIESPSTFIRKQEMVNACICNLYPDV